jgi:teichuronic acid biosynthesis glycosyltransferase TuaC
VLKIAVVTAHFPSSGEPTKGRPAYQTLRVLSRKCDVQVFYPHPAYPSLFKPKSRTYSGLDPSFSLPDVKVGYYDYPVLPMISRPFNGWNAARVLLPHVRNFAPDLIFSYFLYPDGYAAVKIGETLSVPVIVMGVGSDVHSIGDRFSRMHTRTVMKKADFVLGISEDLRERCVAMGAPPEKTRAMVSGCDLSVFHVKDCVEARKKLRIDPASEAIVYIGRMDPKKGLLELVEAAAALRSKHLNLHVFMVGDGPDRPLIENAIQAKDAGSYIHALPGCSFDEVADWMAAADVVTLPSYMEGCPNVILEALACGRPVVATNVGGIPEIMNDECGYLVPPRDSGALAEALASSLDRTWDAKSISAHWGRGWETVAAELLVIFESVLSDRRSKAQPAKKVQRAQDTLA